MGEQELLAKRRLAEEKAESMIAERTRLEAQQKARHIENKLKAAERAKIEKMERAKLVAQQKAFDIQRKREAAERARIERMERAKLEAEKKARDIEIAAERAKAKRMERFRLEEAKRMDYERLKLEAEQKARDIEAKRMAEEQANAERVQAEKARFESMNKEALDVDKARADKAAYQARVTEEMKIATERAEKLIAEEEAILKQNPKDPSFAPSKIDPQEILTNKSAEEARVNEEKLIAIEVVEEANTAYKKAYDEGDTTEVIRLAAIQAQAEQLIKEKNEELTIIAEEKRLAAEILAEMQNSPY